MKASELIALLERKIEEHGDLHVFGEVDWDWVGDVGTEELVYGVVLKLEASYSDLPPDPPDPPTLGVSVSDGLAAQGKLGG